MAPRRGHRLRSEPDAPTPSIFEREREQLGERYEILRHGGGGERIDMVCGAVRFDHPAARKLLALLPRILTFDPAASPTQLEWLRSTLRLMALEAQGLRPGGETMITRLSDVLVVQALRAWLESDPAARSGWLGALQDPQIGRAISLIHRQPGRQWTLSWDRRLVPYRGRGRSSRLPPGPRSSPLAPTARRTARIFSALASGSI